MFKRPHLLTDINIDVILKKIHAHINMCAFICRLRKHERVWKQCKAFINAPVLFVSLSSSFLRWKTRHFCIIFPTWEMRC